MKPQERVNAILQAKVEPSWKILLVSIASHMSDLNLVTWISPETMAEESGLSRSTVMEILKALVLRGIILRYDKGHRAKDTRICWDVLAAQVPSTTRRGGVKVSEHRTAPSEHRTPSEPSDNRTLPSERRTRGSEHRTVAVRLPDPYPSDNRTRSDQEPTTTRPVDPTKGEEPTQTIHGPQATVVLPDPAPQESPLLALLASSGMPMGQAASVARKLLEVGITSPGCPEMEALDEFDLGRIVGTQKGRVIAALRKAGWLPPKERRQQGIPALPPGLKVLDEKGNPIGVIPPTTKQGKKAAEKDDWFGMLQQLVSTEGEANGK